MEHKEQHALPFEEISDIRREKIRHLEYIYQTVDKQEIISGDAVHRSFNDHGTALVREDEPVDSVKELCAKVNVYDYNGSLPGIVKGYMCAAVTLGCYFFCRRHTIPEGYLGHFESSGRHFVRPPGYHSLKSTDEVWKKNILVDGTGYHENKILMGSKCILYVPENHIGGAYRIADADEEEENATIDGQYVLFPNGRYVLQSAKYRRIEVSNLKLGGGEFKTVLGPLTIVHVKEGYLAGAYKTQTGKYEILSPGPPYILHEKDFQDIQIVRREPIFTLGPLTFLTVRDGTLAGAYSKESGKYFIFPPGHTYKIHEKDFIFNRAHDIVHRQPRFNLGPYFFVTVKEGWVAGAYKRRGGEWVTFPPGATYQLNSDKFQEPVLVQLIDAVIKCGPKTYLTVQKDKLAGAWRVEDGKFVQFDNHDRQYILDEKDYHTLSYIDKYSITKQTFGPYSVITIPAGNYGVFERRGHLEIKESGFYQASEDYIMLENIPSNVNTYTLVEKPFPSKDGIKMSISCTLIWQVDVQKVKECAIYVSGRFSQLETSVKALFESTVKKYCKRYNRSELLPTKQELVLRAGVNAKQEEIDELLEQEKKTTTELYIKIQETIQLDMQEAIDQSGWGVKLISTPGEEKELLHGIKLEGFQLSGRDQQTLTIIDNLANITVSLLKKSEESIKGNLAIEQAEIKKMIKIKQIETISQVQKQRAEADAKMIKIAAHTKCDVQKITTKSQANALITKLDAENKVTVLLETTVANCEAAAKEIQLEIECRETKEKAEAEANSIKTISAANFTKSKKENEAAAKMSDNQFKLLQAELAVKAMKHFGSAQWRMPSDVLQFYESFSPYLRMGPITAEELLGEMKVGGRKGR